MNPTLTFKIEGFIENYCSNFLSYLYTSYNWKRCAFDTCKENLVTVSSGKANLNRQIKIMISETAVIVITCNYFTDLLWAIEFIEAQFKYGRMAYYLNVNNAKISFIGTEQYVINDDFHESYSEKGIYITNDNLKLTYQSEKEREELRDIVTNIFKTTPVIISKNLNNSKSINSNNSEKLEDTIQFLPVIKSVKISQEKQEIKEIKEPKLKRDKQTKTKVKELQNQSEKNKFNNQVKTNTDEKKNLRNQSSEKYLVPALIVYSIAKIIEYS